MSENKPINGVYGGSRVFFLEHEVSNWIWKKVRGRDSNIDPLPVPDHPRLLTVKEVEERVGFTRVHIWRLESEGRFPRRIRLEDADAARKCAGRKPGSRVVDGKVVPPMEAGDAAN